MQEPKDDICWDFSPRNVPLGDSQGEKARKDSTRNMPGISIFPCRNRREVSPLHKPTDSSEGIGKAKSSVHSGRNDSWLVGCTTVRPEFGAIEEGRLRRAGLYSRHHQNDPRTIVEQNRRRGRRSTARNGCATRNQEAGASSRSQMLR